MCPHCQGENFYSGSKTTNVVVKCKKCDKAKVKASSHKITKIKDPLPPPKTTKNYRNATMKLPKLTMLTMSNYAINTIHRKKQVIDKDVNSTWYQYFETWSEIRSFIQSLEGDEISLS